MTVDVLRSIDPREIGRRLQEARKARGRTQQDAAEHLDVARTTITAIEKGERRISPSELVRLAAFYGRGVGEILRQGVTVEAFTVQLRASSTPSGITDESIAPARLEFQRLCEDYLELERIAISPLPRRYPPTYDITGASPEAVADDVAISERNRLGLGDGPLLRLREVLEGDVGLRLFYIDMPSSIGEMFTYTDQLGGCIAVNRKHPEERRRMSSSHGYGHFLTGRYQSEVCATAYRRLPAHERFAGAFANAFLMPASGLSRRFREVSRRKEGGITPADLLNLAHLYFVSAEALTRRLEDLHLIRSGAWDLLKQRGFRVREGQESLGLVPHVAPDDMLPTRYQLLAVEALQQGDISQGQFARYLRTDPVSAREIAARLASGTAVADDGTIETIPVELTAEPISGGS